MAGTPPSWEVRPSITCCDGSFGGCVWRVDYEHSCAAVAGNLRNWNELRKKERNVLPNKENMTSH